MARLGAPDLDPSASSHLNLTCPQVGQSAMRGLSSSLQTDHGTTRSDRGNTRGADSVVASFPGVATTREHRNRTEYPSVRLSRKSPFGAGNGPGSQTDLERMPERSGLQDYPGTEQKRSTTPSNLPRRGEYVCTVIHVNSA
jgi:hypothetical protein